jgi:hypothetical protein
MTNKVNEQPTEQEIQEATDNILKIFFQHQRRAFDEFILALEGLIPERFREHTQNARQQFTESFKALFGISDEEQPAEDTASTAPAEPKSPIAAANKEALRKSGKAKVEALTEPDESPTTETDKEETRESAQLPTPEKSGLLTEPEGQQALPEPSGAIHFLSSQDEPYGCFANTAAYGFDAEGTEWRTAEHFFQAHKYVGTADFDAIRNARSAMIAASMGNSKKRQPRGDWEAVKDDIMRQAIRYKVRANPEVQERLLGTGNLEIINDDPKDDYWGVGEDGRGQNMLGKILMEVRESLRS